MLYPPAPNLKTYNLQLIENHAMNQTLCLVALYLTHSQQTIWILNPSLAKKTKILILFKHRIGKIILFTK